MEGSTLLEIRDLRTYFFLSGDQAVKAVDGVDLEIRRGQVFGLVGESGSGKSVTARTILRLLDPRARVISGEIRFKGDDLLTMDAKRIRHIRGRQISMVFQDPGAALNPALKIERQVKNAVTAHRKVDASEARQEAIRLLEGVKLNEPQRVLQSYPHELSGGMQQRVVIAIALASDPELIIADEPTTALDVTTQLDILSLFDELRTSRKLAMLFITHNFGVVAYMCDRVAVMRQGQIVERGAVRNILDEPGHPYTRRLLDAIPDPQRKGERRLSPGESLAESA